MSTLDTMTPVISTPWLDVTGRALSTRSLPGLRPEVLKTLERAYPGKLTPAFAALLSVCCGLADTDLGHLDFTGCCFPDEACSVFHPCLTIAIDDSGRRWIAELGGRNLPGPVWCVFSEPEVAVHVSDDLTSFLATLRDRACRGQSLAWLQQLTVTARAIWSHRRALARRPKGVDRSNPEVQRWLAGLPSHTYVYDLRIPSNARGWPYGVAGPSARLFRCGRLPVFAVAGSPTDGSRATISHTTPPIYPVGHVGAELPSAASLPGARPAHFRPPNPSRRPDYSDLRLCA